MNIASDVAEEVRRVQHEDGITATEHVRRAIAVYKLIRDTRRDGGKVLIQDDAGTRELVLL